jgi:hypothetical protein
LQSLVSLSTTKSKYIAATKASKEGIWICSFISQVFEPTYTIIQNPTDLKSDNQAAIALSQDHQFHGRTKHIKMLADTLTKALPSAKAKHFAASLGLGPV